jgi:hypothetical protein
LFALANVGLDFWNEQDQSRNLEVKIYTLIFLINLNKSELIPITEPPIVNNIPK